MKQHEINHSIFIDRNYQNGCLSVIPKEKICKYAKEYLSEIKRLQKIFPLFSLGDIVFIHFTFSERVEMSFIEQVLTDATNSFMHYIQFYAEEVTIECMTQCAIKALNNRNSFLVEQERLRDEVNRSMGLLRGQTNAKFTDFSNLAVIHALDVSTIPRQIYGELKDVVYV